MGISDEVVFGRPQSFIDRLPVFQVRCSESMAVQGVFDLVNKLKAHAAAAPPASCPNDPYWGVGTVTWLIDTESGEIECWCVYHKNGTTRVIPCP